MENTAAELGVSVVGVRKRLLRVENLLGRSLLNGPSARYDLYLALRVLDAAN
ncbi:helix-turn-helix domain-containing protein [Saccharopolyspora shandongensis]|uniref:helix-turn-helix domain-containing protein n=1 Tax=Saccharopolyspora shandongensis TaxID=418495 RepID=UPI0033E3F468